MTSSDDVAVSLNRLIGCTVEMAMACGPLPLHSVYFLRSKRKDAPDAEATASPSGKKIEQWTGEGCTIKLDFKGF